VSPGHNTPHPPGGRGPRPFLAQKPGKSRGRPSCNACRAVQDALTYRYPLRVSDSPAPPAGTGPSGRALWRRIVSDLDASLELDQRDVETLGAAADLADRIRGLKAAIERDGLILDGSRGSRLHPAVAELRMSEQALVRHLSMLDLDAAAVSQSTVSRGARKRAEKQWAVAGPSRRSEGVA
jgi:phage terminase small subunit